MSKVTIEIEIDRYACTEIEDLRKMYQTRDFSGMMASLERLQIHCQVMEDALYSNKYKKLFERHGVYSYEDAQEFMDKVKEERKSKEEKKGE